MAASALHLEGFVVIDYLHRSDEAIAAIAPLLAAGKLKSKVDVIEGIARFPEALRRLLAGKNDGKIWTAPADLQPISFKSDGLLEPRSAQQR